MYNEQMVGSERKISTVDILERYLSLSLPLSLSLSLSLSLPQSPPLKKTVL
ncbi:MAG: hypothetical protein ACRC4N_01155 [Gammaproteobacteria bacterium]